MVPALKTLHQRFGSKRCLTAAADLRPYGFDATATFEQIPIAILFPQSAEDVAFTLKVCAKADIPIVTRGTGTGLSGGSVPVPGCVVLCLVEMDRILELDANNLNITVEPGVITAAIDERAAAHGLFYPPDPGSLKISTIGGNVANNSGGLRGLKYGVTRDYVMGLEVVTPNGEIQWIGNKCVKDVAGYSLRDLFIGSEGTLGVITKILLKLLPRPATKQTLLATYSSLEEAAATVSAIIAAKIIPCTLEFLDHTTIRCVEDFAQVGLPTDCAALLLMETDGHPIVVEEEAAAMEAIARQQGALEIRKARSEAEALELATARRSAFSALARIRPTTILEDVTVPRSELVRMVRCVQEVAERHQVQIATFGHMGDGNLHPTFLTDERDHEAMERVEAALKEIFKCTIQLGGTITGEHGVGLAKKDYLPMQYDAGSLQLLRQVKQTLDPKQLLNPGKIFDYKA